MSRAKLQKGKQRVFLNKAARYFDFDWSKIAKVSNISERTLNDWRREKYNMSYKALLALSRYSNVSVPKVLKILPEYWSTKKACRLGAIRRNELHGNPGTPEGRSKGGATTSRMFRQDHRFAEAVGFKLRTPINIPIYSSKLAEFIGAMLGDGYIKTNKTQLGISLNSETDYSYALYIQSLIKKLFSLRASVRRDGSDKSVTVLVSSRNLVEFLIDNDLKAGNKVINQVSIPRWINLKREYKIACLRGLMDTDGSFYSYFHRVNGKVYKNYALDFTNCSMPLLQGVKNILQDLGYAPTAAKYKVILYKKRDIGSYISMVGSSNPVRKRKFISCKIS